MLNYLAENGINNYEELKYKLDTAHKQTDIYDKEIEKINIKIYERRSIIKYARICWQYQLIYEKYRKIPDFKDKEMYKAEHIREINSYKRAAEMLERSKLPDGSLVKSSDVMNEIEKLEKLKKELEVKRLKSRSEIDRLENIKFNIQTGEHKKQRKNMQKENIIQER